MAEYAVPLNVKEFVVAKDVQAPLSGEWVYNGTIKLDGYGHVTMIVRSDAPHDFTLHVGFDDEAGVNDDTSTLYS